MTTTTLTTARRATAEDLRELKRERPEVLIARVTPALATSWLESKAPNRTIRMARVEQFARDIREGRWELNGETIKFDREGGLLDGQHRLWAVIEADHAIDSALALGLDRKSILTVDIGAPRRQSDQLQLLGVPNAPLVAACARLWHRYDLGKVLDQSSLVSFAEVQAALAAHPTVPDAVRRSKHANAVKLGHSTALAFALSGALETDPDRANSWYEGLLSGAGLEGTNPAWVLRETLLADRASRTKINNLDILASCMKSWLAFAAGKSANRQALTWYRSKNEPFPTFPKRKGAR